MKKIKGRFAKPNSIMFIAVAAISLCLLLPLRVFETAILIEPKTGFFIGSHPVIPIFYALLACVTAFCFIGSFVNDPCNRTRDCVKVNNPLGIVGILTGIAILYDAFDQIKSFIELKASSENVPLYYIENRSTVGSNGAFALCLGGIFGVLSAFFFFLYALQCFNKNANIKGFKILSVMPVVWGIFRIVFRFIRKISFVNVSDLLLELFMLVFMIAFFLAFAQIVTGVAPEIAAWRLYGCGLPAALLAFLTSVPRLFLLIFKSELLIDDYEFNACDLMIAIFIPLFLFFTSRVEKKLTE